MASLNYLEMKLIDRCNYSCRACIPFSNIAGHGVYEIEEFEKDMTQLAGLFDKIETIRLLGGETFLLENLAEYIKVVRRFYKESQLIIVTNGSLLHKLSEEECACLRQSQVKIYVSLYPNEKTMGKVLENIEVMKEKHIEVDSYRAKYFCVNQDYSERNLTETELQEIYERCRKVVDCTNLYKGRIYACPKPFSYVHLNKKFGTNFYFEEDGIDIYTKGICAQDIKEYLKHHMKACSLCTLNRGFLKWSNEPAKSLHEWENSKENDALFSNGCDDKTMNELLDTKVVISKYVNGKMESSCQELTIQLLEELNEATLLIKNYNIQEFELFMLASAKAGIKISSIYADDEVYGSIAQQEAEPLETFTHGILKCGNYLILDKSVFESLKLARKIEKYI